MATATATPNVELELEQLYNPEKVIALLLDGVWHAIIPGSYKVFGFNELRYFIAHQTIKMDDGTAFVVNLIGDDEAIKAIKEIQS